MVRASGTPRSSLPPFIVDSSEDEYEGHPESYPLIGLYDRPLPCFGCGMGWFSFILGFVFPLAWYCGAFLYLTNYYEYDPRERSGLAAAAIMSSWREVQAGIIRILFGTLPDNASGGR